jgi:hypothetical protein
MAEDDYNVPARYRARSLLRECQALVTRLLDANEALIGRRGGADSTFQPQQIMSKLVERQQALRCVVDECKYRCPVDRLESSHCKSRTTRNFHGGSRREGLSGSSQDKRCVHESFPLSVHQED